MKNESENSGNGTSNPESLEIIAECSTRSNQDRQTSGVSKHIQNVQRKIEKHQLEQETPQQAQEILQNVNEFRVIPQNVQITSQKSTTFLERDDSVQFDQNVQQPPQLGQQLQSQSTRTVSLGDQRVYQYNQMEQSSSGTRRLLRDEQNRSLLKDIQAACMLSDTIPQQDQNYLQVQSTHDYYGSVEDISEPSDLEQMNIEGDLVLLKNSEFETLAPVVLSSETKHNFVTYENDYDGEIDDDDDDDDDDDKNASHSKIQEVVNDVPVAHQDCVASEHSIEYQKTIELSEFLKFEGVDVQNDFNKTLVEDSANTECGEQTFNNDVEGFLQISLTSDEKKLIGDSFEWKTNLKSSEEKNKIAVTEAVAGCSKENDVLVTHRDPVLSKHTEDLKKKSVKKRIFYRYQKQLELSEFLRLEGDVEQKFNKISEVDSANTECVRQTPDNDVAGCSKENTNLLESQNVEKVKIDREVKDKRRKNKHSMKSKHLKKHLSVRKKSKCTDSQTDLIKNECRIPDDCEKSQELVEIKTSQDDSVVDVHIRVQSQNQGLRSVESDAEEPDINPQQLQTEEINKEINKYQIHLNLGRFLQISVTPDENKQIGGSFERKTNFKSSEADNKTAVTEAVAGCSKDNTNLLESQDFEKVKIDRKVKVKRRKSKRLKKARSVRKKGRKSRSVKLLFSRIDDGWRVGETKRPASNKKTKCTESQTDLNENECNIPDGSENSQELVEIKTNQDDSEAEVQNPVLGFDSGRWCEVLHSVESDAEEPDINPQQLQTEGVEKQEINECQFDLNVDSTQQNDDNKDAPEQNSRHRIEVCTFHETEGRSVSPCPTYPGGLEFYEMYIQNQEIQQYKLRMSHPVENEPHVNSKSFNNYPRVVPPIVPCPLGMCQLSPCSWLGFYQNRPSHVTTCHRDVLIHGTHIKLGVSSAVIISAFNELFVMYTTREQNLLHCVVQHACYYRPCYAAFEYVCLLRRGRKGCDMKKRRVATIFQTFSLLKHVDECVTFHNVNADDFYPKDILIEIHIILPSDIN